MLRYCKCIATCFRLCGLHRGGDELDVEILLLVSDYVVFIKKVMN